MRMYSDCSFSFKRSIWSNNHVSMYRYTEVRFKYSLEILIVFCLLSMYGFPNSPLHLPACPLLCSNSCNDMLADTAES